MKLVRNDTTNPAYGGPSTDFEGNYLESCNKYAAEGPFLAFLQFTTEPSQSEKRTSIHYIRLVHAVLLRYYNRHILASLAVKKVKSSRRRIFFISIRLSHSGLDRPGSGLAASSTWGVNVSLI
jgi:hypothetical protein